jgi:prepilin-type N-terminal cleavage/methylation domain-containing protein
MKTIRPHRRRGFTMVELLVVIGIILFLVTISITLIGNMISKARQAATAATIQKIDGLLNERLQAFARAFEDTDLSVSLNRMTQSLRANNIYVRSSKDPAVRILVRKDLFRENFPQVNGDSTKFPLLPSVPNDPAESSENLYWMLTQADVFGVAPVDASEFKTSEVKDTDGDGRLEFVDAWGNPLRFYRWPTRLLKPWGPNGPDGQPGTANGGPMGNGDDDRNGTANDLQEQGWPGSDDNALRSLAGLLMTGLPSLPPVGERDPLNEDPDDTLSRLTHSATPVPFYFNNWFNEAN